MRYVDGCLILWQFQNQKVNDDIYPTMKCENLHKRKILYSTSKTI